MDGECQYDVGLSFEEGVTTPHTSTTAKYTRGKNKSVKEKKITTMTKMSCAQEMTELIMYI